MDPLMLIGLVLIFGGSLSEARGPEASGADVDHAIQTLTDEYTRKLCESIKEVNCADHYTFHDEQICASSGVTYMNHCEFSRDQCGRVLAAHRHDKPQLLYIVRHGPCHPVTTPTTTTTTTTARPTTPRPITMAATTAPTRAPTTTSTPAPTTTTSTTVPTTTTVSIHNILMGVFCQHAETFVCNQDYNILCGSDGVFYPNECALNKAKCKNPSLVESDMSQCQV